MAEPNPRRLEISFGSTCAKEKVVTTRRAVHRLSSHCSFSILPPQNAVRMAREFSYQCYPRQAFDLTIYSARMDSEVLSHRYPRGQIHVARQLRSVCSRNGLRALAIRAESKMTIKRNRF